MADLLPEYRVTNGDNTPVHDRNGSYFRASSPQAAAEEFALTRRSSLFIDVQPWKDATGASHHPDVQRSVERFIAYTEGRVEFASSYRIPATV